MVYTGKPSTGCENCRRAKKRCDEGLPACGRCIRLGKACGGYRDIGELMFRDQSASIARRASAQSDPGVGSSGSLTTRQPTPDKEVAARMYFFDHFVTSSHLTFLEGVVPDEFLQKPILACGLAGLANRENDSRSREMARRYYVEAIGATNTALRHSRRAKEDNTLIAVFLLGLFERLTWEHSSSVQSWKHHVAGASNILQLRGRNQVRTRTGAQLFRELRGNIIVNALLCETRVPEYIIQWGQALEHNPRYTPGDEISVLAARTAAIRAALRTGDKPDEELAQLTSTLETDLLGWSESTLAAGSICSFHNVQDLDSPHAWNGTRHHYGIPQAHRHWNMWRSLRILVSRIQEAIWRRSWPTLAQPSQPPPSTEHYKTVRNRMTADICIAAAYAFGNDSSAPPPLGSISSGYLLITPLCLAGTCLLEQLAEATVSPGGSRMILVDTPLHNDPFNQTSTQLAWIIERVDYIADKVGIKWASAVGRFLKGECKIYYDLGRSRVVHESVSVSCLLSEMLEVPSIAEDLEFDDLTLDVFD